MTSNKKHTEIIEQNFGSQAVSYLNSQLHATGEDLNYLSELLQSSENARLLDLGCGGGHVSYTAATLVCEVVAYDLSESMLNVVKKTAKERNLPNIHTQQGIAESLPFEDASFDIVVSRYSAHHWQNVSLAMQEVRRVLKPAGKAIFIDIVSTGYPMLDIHLQTIEVLRDTSHVQDYSPAQWLSFFNLAGLKVPETRLFQVHMEFQSWIARMKTPDYFVLAIRELQKIASNEVKEYFQIRPDGSFSVDTMMIVGTKI